MEPMRRGIFPAALVRLVLLPFLVFFGSGAGCRAADRAGKTYPVTGQVLGIRPDIRELRLAHDEIPGYMPAMSMSFAVKDLRLLDGLSRGDLVRGTLVVTETDAWLSTLDRTGHQPVPESADEAGASGPAAAPAELVEPGQPVPEATFTDQDGKPYDIHGARGRAVALTFIYTRCPLPTFCPRMDRQFLAAQNAIAARPDLRGRVQLLTISFDPAFDTPAVLRQHAASLGADLSSWRFLTADAETVERFATRFGVSIVREGDGTADITHNLRTAVIGPDGRVVEIYTGGDWTPEQLVADLAAALAPS
jgi:protein SCO1/2